MITLFEKDTCPHEGNEPDLASILRPILPDLEAVQGHLARTLRGTNDRPVREVVDFLLGSPGKQMRPALTLLAARAAGGPGNGSPGPGRVSLNVAAAVELIHMASLVHDDLIDAAEVRHHRPSIAAKWGKRVAAAVGDHLCGQAFRLVADCADPRLFAILGSSLCAMCGGELLQVAWRGDFSLSEHHCLTIVEKKTAALFGACCRAGAVIAAHEPATCEALEKFGFHFGVAFQILDDCRDLLGDEERLGKTRGQDLRAGVVTLPLMHVTRYLWRRGEEMPDLKDPATGGQELARLREVFHSSPAPRRLTQLVISHADQAKQQLELLADSDFRMSLQQLADYIQASALDTLIR